MCLVATRVFLLSLNRFTYLLWLNVCSKLFNRFVFEMINKAKPQATQIKRKTGNTNYQYQ